MLNDTIFCFYASQKSKLSNEMHFHHVLSLYGVFVSIYIGGFIGSISQLTWITEGSTLFVNIRHMMVFHKLEETKLYLVNGVCIALSFAIFRIYYYHFMIFDIIVHYVLYRAGSFWKVFYTDPFM